MAKEMTTKQTINELWQKIFELTQDEKILQATTDDIKAYTGGGKWIIHVPGLCKISLKLDEGAGTGKPVATETPIQGMENETGFMTAPDEADIGESSLAQKDLADELGEGFIKKLARDYEEDDK